jgi:hypothetical protein
MSRPITRPPLVSLAVVAAAVIAIALGFGAVQELVVRGVRGGEPQPLAVGAVGAVASGLLLAAAAALWREAAGAPRLAGVAAAVSAGFHAYAALPPHRNVGPAALLLALAASAALLWLARRTPRPVSGVPAS